MNNPFNPAFGKRPEIFLGREDIIYSFMSSIDEPNSPWRTTLLIGVRGSGKTAILSDIAGRIDDKESTTVLISPVGNFLDDILGDLHRQLPKRVISRLPQVKSVAANLGVSLVFEHEDGSLPSYTHTFRYQLMTILDEYKKLNRNIVFLIDEAQKHSEEMRIFISVYQNLIQKEYAVSMMLAGLPQIISEILNDDVLTFLRRANQVSLENLSIPLVQVDYFDIFEKGGFKLSDDFIRTIAVATFGYPYLLQLMGYYVWNNLSNTESGSVAHRSLVQAKAMLFKNVHELIFVELTNVERDFVYAMIEDTHQSNIGDIGVRMGKDKSYTSLYRSRLISRGVIKPSGHGMLTFTLPYMREYIIEKKQELGY